MMPHAGSVIAQCSCREQDSQCLDSHCHCHCPGDFQWNRAALCQSAFFIGTVAVFVGAASFVYAAESMFEYNENGAFRVGVARLQAVQQAIVDGDLSKAKTLCLAIIISDEPTHLRWEAQERLREIERVEQGLPHRDPQRSRTKLPKRPQPAATFFVAPDGNDSNPGTGDKPFRTLERARDAIRGLRQEGEIAQRGCGGAVARG